jgi:hypothetical protein
LVSASGEGRLPLAHVLIYVAVYNLLALFYFVPALVGANKKNARAILILELFPGLDASRMGCGAGVGCDE